MCNAEVVLFTDTSRGSVCWRVSWFCFLPHRHHVIFSSSTLSVTEDYSLALLSVKARVLCLKALFKLLGLANQKLHSEHCVTCITVCSGFCLVNVRSLFFYFSNGSSVSTTSGFWFDTTGHVYLIYDFFSAYAYQCDSRCSLCSADCRPLLCPPFNLMVPVITHDWSESLRASNTWRAVGRAEGRRDHSTILIVSIKGKKLTIQAKAWTPGA